MKRVRFIEEPVIQPHPKGHKFQLVRDWHLEINGKEVIVPAGFWTDFASIPKCFRSLISPLDEHLKAAILHDWLYYESKLFGKKISIKAADDIFLTAMRMCGTGWIKRHTMYAGVRTGGWVAYNNYRRLKW